MILQLKICLRLCKANLRYFDQQIMSCMFVCQISPYNFWLFSFPIVISLNKRRMKTSHQMMKSESFWWHSFYINDRLATSMVSLLYCIADFFFFPQVLVHFSWKWLRQLTICCHLMFVNILCSRNMEDLYFACIDEWLLFNAHRFYT